MKKLTLLFAAVMFFAAAGVSRAQQGGVTQVAPDPCNIYPHLTAIIPAAATPSAVLIPGQAGKQINVCGWHFTMSGSSPFLVFSSGSLSAATPCATGTASEKMTAFTEGGGGAGSLAGAGNAWDNTFGSGSNTQIGPIPPVPTATALTYDLCVQTGTTGTVGGYVTYVIH